MAVGDDKPSLTQPLPHGRKSNLSIEKQIFGVCRNAVGNAGHPVDKQSDLPRNVGVMRMEVRNAVHLTNEAAGLAESEQRILQRAQPPSADRVNQRSAVIP